MKFKSPSVVFPLVEDLTKQIVTCGVMEIKGTHKMYQDNKVDIKLDGETLFDPDNFDEMLQ